MPIRAYSMQNWESLNNIVNYLWNPYVIWYISRADPEGVQGVRTPPPPLISTTPNLTLKKILHPGLPYPYPGTTILLTLTSNTNPNGRTLATLDRNT